MNILTYIHTYIYTYTGIQHGYIYIHSHTYIHTYIRSYVSFPHKNAERSKNPSHETESLSETVHGCRILPYLAYNRCASLERTTQRRDFTRSAPGKTIF